MRALKGQIKILERAVEISANKSGIRHSQHKHNKSVVENVEDEEMDKILNELRHFKEHINGSKKRMPSKNHK